MEIRCPAHGFRQLGYLRWLPSGLPLQAEDQNLCSCPPCPVREFLQGQRGPLTEGEQREVEQRRERESGSRSDENFRREQASLEPLLRTYQSMKRNRRRMND